jgi:hypothetical protein
METGAVFFSVLRFTEGAAEQTQLKSRNSMARSLLLKPV